MLTTVWAFLKYETHTQKGNIKNIQLDEFQPTEHIHAKQRPDEDTGQYYTPEASFMTFSSH